MKNNFYYTQSLQIIQYNYKNSLEYQTKLGESKENPKRILNLLFVLFSKVLWVLSIQRLKNKNKKLQFSCSFSGHILKFFLSSFIICGVFQVRVICSLLISIICIKLLLPIYAHLICTCYNWASPSCQCSTICTKSRFWSYCR